MTETREYHTTDKTGWGEGPWADEPDKRQWAAEVTGFPCLIVRGPMGALCGYVGVPASHPAHGHNYASYGYGDDGERLPRSALDEAINDLEAHGGLTFADGCGHGADESKGICHVPGPGEPDDVWWFGFDCAHAGDLTPRCDAGRGMYRDVAYVTGECASLAKQLAAISA